MDREVALLLYNRAYDQGQQEISAAIRAVHALRYENKYSDPPESVSLPRWRAMINFILNHEDSIPAEWSYSC